MLQFLELHFSSSGFGKISTFTYAATIFQAGFPQALEIMENLENHKKVSCLEKSWDLKKTLNNHGKIMEVCEII